MISTKDIIKEMLNPTKADCLLIEKAYSCAEKAHDGQLRKSGEPYITHAAFVGLELAKMGMGPRTITAGLLHDTIEDTVITAEIVKKEFGEEILFLVEGVTKLSSVRYYGSDRHNESLRKLFVATSQDIRVLIIKLIDRLHNMQTLEFVDEKKQQRIAQETLEIYVPVAHRLGIGKLRKSLEDLAFPYVYPKEYERVLDLVKGKIKKSEITLEREKKTLQKKFVENGIRDFNTSYRIKGMFSLYHKLKRKDWDIEQIYDLLALRVVVSSMEECYRTLGIIHEIWRPLPKRIKDYISFPKPNGYQSIHTTVATQHGTILEIQIRTQKMHHEAEYGVTSHIIYKEKTEGKPTSDQVSRFSNLIPSLFRPFTWREQPTTEADITKDTPHYEKIPKWINLIGEMYSEDKSSGKEFIDDMRKDFFTHRIFVFTPHGDVVDLPVGATAIDFAYAIHSEVGSHTSGAKVNRKLVGLETELKNGDIVEIETNKNSKPTQKWLNATKTSLARRRIKSALAEDQAKY